MTWGIFKSDSVSEAYKKMKSSCKEEKDSCSCENDKEEKKEIEEELKGKQHKLDKNKNGKLDSQDFKMLRKEEAEQLDEMEFDKNGRYVHKAKPGVYGGSEKDKHYVDTLAGPKKTDLEKIAAKKVKKEGLELFNEKELDILINEVLSANEPAGKWISDFVHSDNPKFAGKSKEKRKQMALAAYYSAQRKESTDYESFITLDEAVQGDIVKKDAKEIKHANMKDKQDDQEVMEPHSGTEQQFVDAHTISVTDEPNKDGTPNGADKAKRADEPKGKGPASYDAKEKLGKQGEVKEAITTTAAGEEIDTEPTEKKANDKKKFGQLKKKVAAADSNSNY